MRKTALDYGKKIELKYYRNDFGFVGGKIREKPEDFVVEEVSDFDYNEFSEKKQKQFDYLLVKIKSKNWDTNDLIRVLSNKLGISKNRISFAGTKDKKAITTQFFTFYKIKKQEILNLDINGVNFLEFGLTNNEINIGDLVGNNFKIKLKETKNLKDVDKIIDKLERKGIINYYGPQRFGQTRPITHLVGKEIVKENYKKATKIYVSKPFSAEKEDIRSKRKEINKKWGEKKVFKKGLRDLPKYLSYERTLLHHLAENPNDFPGALKKLPNNLLNLFIHAYQSYLFNKAINYRIENGLSLNKVTKGDVVCYTDLKTNIPNRKVTERITERNEQKIKEMIKEEKAYPTAPLFGTKTKLALGKMGEIEESILEEENLDLNDFRIKKIPQISSSGMRREVITYPKFDEIKKTKNYLELRFFLPKGTYATCVTREFRGE